MMDYEDFETEVFLAESDKFETVLRQLCDAVRQAKNAGCNHSVIRDILRMHPRDFLRNRRFLMDEERYQEAFKSLHSLIQDVDNQMNALYRKYPFTENVLAKVKTVLSSEYPEYALEVFDGEINKESGESSGGDPAIEDKTQADVGNTITSAMLSETTFEQPNKDRQNEGRQAERGANAADADLIQNTSATFSRQLDICASPAMANKNILLLGETGVGKTHYANVIHDKAVKGGNAPLIYQDCGGFGGGPRTIAAEICGYGKSAFTGADKDYPGKAKEAVKGTLVLDEIGSLEPNDMKALLSLMGNRTITPERKSSEVIQPIRVIACTDKDEAVFRNDCPQLYNRFDEIVRIPPLRVRQGDIMVLLPLFFEVARNEDGRTITLSQRAAQDIIDSEYLWPGNVRQLEKAVARAIRRKTDLNKSRSLTGAEILTAAQEQ